MLTLQLEKHSGWGFAANCSFSAKTIARTRNDLNGSKGPAERKEAGRDRTETGGTACRAAVPPGDAWRDGDSATIPPLDRFGW
jgi:hypothetical protein